MESFPFPDLNEKVWNEHFYELINLEPLLDYQLP